MSDLTLGTEDKVLDFANPRRVMRANRKVRAPSSVLGFGQLTKGINDACGLLTSRGNSLGPKICVTTGTQRDKR